MQRSALPLPPRLQMELDKLANIAADPRVELPSGVAQTSSATGLRLQLSRKEWEEIKPLIERLYIEENQTFPYIQHVLAESHHFRPTKKQFASKIKEWGFRKNLKRSERSDILQTVGPIDADLILDSTGRKHKKQKLLRWEKEDLGSHPTKVPIQGSAVVKGNGDPEDSSVPATSGGIIQGGNELLADKATDHNFSAAEVELKRSVWMKDDEEYKYYPHARWLNADVTNSPNLTRLFEGLAIETKNLPDDIEELILSPPVVEQHSTIVTEVATWSDLTYQSCNENSLSITCVDGETTVPESKGHPIKTIAVRSSIRSSPKPFQFCGSDAWVPSGVEFGRPPSPFQELYPFPTSPPCVIRTRRSSIPQKQLWKNEEIEASRSLAQLKQAGFGETHPAMRCFMLRLADAFYFQHNYRQAEKIYTRFLAAKPEDSERWSEGDFEARIHLIDNVTLQGRLEEAKTMVGNLYDVVVSRFSPDHTIFRLFLQIKGRLFRYLEAHMVTEAIRRDLVQICLVHFGLRSSNTLNAISDLAVSIGAQGRYAESERLQRYLLQLCQEDPDDGLIRPLLDLARIFKKQGRLDEGIKLCRAASEKTKDMCEECDVISMDSNYWLGIFLREKGLLEESEKTLVTTATLQVAVLGENALHYLCTIYGLGLTLLQRKKYDEATTWLEKHFRIQVNHGLPLHDAFLSCQGLGVCYGEQGQYLDALTLYQEAIGIFRAAKRKSDAEHSRIDGWISEIQGWIHEVLERVDEENKNNVYDEEAAVWFEKCFRKSLTLVEPDYKITLDSCFGLARCYGEQGRFRDANAVYQEAVGFVLAALEKNQDDISANPWVFARLQGWNDELRQRFDKGNGNQDRVVVDLE